MSLTASFEIQHTTRYTYAEPVRHCVMALCMRPRDDRGQTLRSFDVWTDPPSSMTTETDSFGNEKHVLSVLREHTSIGITALSRVEARAPAAVPGALGGDAWRQVGALARSFAHWEFLHPSLYARSSPALAAFLRKEDLRPGGDLLQSLVRLSDALHEAFDYVPGSTTAVSPIDHILDSGRGVCQDYAHVMIAIARSWRIPARYVSGYLFASKPGQEELGAQSHAWVECLLPGLSWVGFDPTNHTAPDQRYVRVAVGRDYHDVAPTRGVRVGGGASLLEVSVRMLPLD